MGATGFPGGRRGVVEAALAHRAAGREAALAVVVATTGSTYRKAGALAVFDAGGEAVGTLSGGCLEPELARRARGCIERGQVERLALDTAGDDDLLFGSGSGCRGRMELGLLPLARADVAACLDRLAARDRVVLECRDGGSRLAALDAASADAVDWRVPIRAVPRLLLVGAGPETGVLAPLARRMGWWVELIEHRPERFEASAGLALDRRVAARPAAGLAGPAGERFDAAVVMTHVASIDREALEILAAGPTGYIGLLGPPARRAELVGTLEPALRARLDARLRGPAGLRLGGDGPEAIALAVAADLHRHFHETTDPT